MKDDATGKSADRRSCLKLAGASLVGTGAAVTATGAAAAPAQTPKGTAAGDYHETAHIKRYYDLAREF